MRLHAGRAVDRGAGRGRGARRARRAGRGARARALARGLCQLRAWLRARAAARALMPRSGACRCCSSGSTPRRTVRRAPCRRPRRARPLRAGMGRRAPCSRLRHGARADRRGRYLPGQPHLSAGPRRHGHAAGALRGPLRGAAGALRRADRGRGAARDPVALAGAVLSHRRGGMHRDAADEGHAAAQPRPGGGCTPPRLPADPTRRTAPRT